MALCCCHPCGNQSQVRVLSRRRVLSRQATGRPFHAPEIAQAKKVGWLVVVLSWGLAQSLWGIKPRQLGDDEIHHDYAPHRGFRSPVAAEAAQLQPIVGVGYLPLFAFYPLSAFGLVPRALINTRISTGDPSSCNTRTRKLLNSQIPHWHSLPPSIPLPSNFCSPAPPRPSTDSRHSTNLFPTPTPPNPTFKMTGGGKSGGKASGSKNAQS
jgi:hypothetical protein